MSESHDKSRRCTHTKNSRSLFCTPSYIADPEFLSALLNDPSPCPVQSSNVSAQGNNIPHHRRRKSMDLFLDKFAELKSENSKLKEKIGELDQNEEEKVLKNTQYLQDYLVELNSKRNKLEEEYAKLEVSVHGLNKINTSYCKINLVEERKELIGKLNNLNDNLRYSQSFYASHTETEILTHQIKQIENTQTSLLNRKVLIEQELSLLRNNQDANREEDVKKEFSETLKELKVVRHLAKVIFNDEKEELTCFFDFNEEIGKKEIAQIVSEMKDQLQNLKEMVLKIIGNNQYL